MTAQEREEKILAVLDRVRAGEVPDLDYAQLRVTAVELVNPEADAGGGVVTADDREELKAKLDTQTAQAEKWSRMWDEERNGRQRAIEQAVRETRERCADAARVAVELIYKEPDKAAEVAARVRGGG